MSLHYVVNSILNGQRNYCCLCLNTVGNESIRLLDEVGVNQTTEEMFDILSFILGDADVNGMSSLDLVCEECKVLAVNSYTFIKMCKETCKHLYNAIDNLTNCLPNLGALDFNSAFISVDGNFENCKCYYDHKRPVQTHSAVLKRFKCVTNMKKPKKEFEYESDFYMSPHVDTEDNINFDNVIKKVTKRTRIPMSHIMYDENNFKCKECLKIYSNAFRLKQHYIRVHAPKLFKCPNCPRRYGSEGLLHQHKLDSHTPAICSECGKSYDNRQSLKFHELGHKQKLVCQACGRTYKHKKTFNKHIQTNMCQQKGRKSNMDAIFTCDYCDKKFSNKPTLRVHIQFQHGNAKAHICMWCKKRFNAQSRLMAHIVTHTQEKKFACDTCNGKFVTRESLMCHIRIHTGERPYKCDLCDKSFLSSSRRADHVRRHHAGPTLECEICHSRFKARTCLMRHKKRHFNPKSRLHCSQKD